MKKVGLWLFLIVVIVALTAVFSLFGCKAEEAAMEEEPMEEEAMEEEPMEEEAMEEEMMEKDMSDFDIVFIVKVDGIAWFDTERAGLDACAADYGFGSATTIGPPTADAALQAQMIEDQIAAGVEAIGIVPNDPAAVEPVLKKAMDLGIITYAHEGSAMENINFDIEAMSNVTFGETIFERGISDSGDTGQYVWSVGWLTSTSHNEWVDAGIALQQEKYPDKVNALGYTAGSDRFEEQEDTTIAHDKILEFLNTYPEINQLFGSPMTTMVAAGLAIEEKGLKDKVFACGTGLPITIGDHLKNGVVQEGFFWDPWGVGYALGYAAMMEYLGTPMQPGDPVLRPDGTPLKRYESIDRAANAAGGDVISGTGLERVNLDNLEEWDEIFKGYGF